jgi:hypothetical protein
MQDEIHARYIWDTCICRGDQDKCGIHLRYHPYPKSYRARAHAPFPLYPVLNSSIHPCPNPNTCPHALPTDATHSRRGSTTRQIACTAMHHSRQRRRPREGTAPLKIGDTTDGDATHLPPRCCSRRAPLTHSCSRQAVQTLSLTIMSSIMSYPAGLCCRALPMWPLCVGRPAPCTPYAHLPHTTARSKRSDHPLCVGRRSHF